MGERRKRVRRPEAPTLYELRAIFHRLWGSQVGQPNYKKRDWVEVQTMLFRIAGLRL